MSEIPVEPGGIGRVETRELEQEMRSSFLDYAMSVIVSRSTIRTLKLSASCSTTETS